MTVHFPVLYHINTAKEPGSLIWCYAVMSLQFTHISSFACRCRLRNLLADCSTVDLYSNNMAKNLQIFTSSYGSRRFAACDCLKQTSLASVARLSFAIPNSRNVASEKIDLS